MVDLALGGLPEFDLGWLGQRTPRAKDPAVDGQDAATFAEQRTTIEAATPTRRWLRPSRHDGDRLPDAGMAAELMRQIDAVGDGVVLPDPEKMARIVMSTLALPEITRMQPGLVPEVAGPNNPSRWSGRPPIDGRADAVSLGGGGGMVVIDWKSDVNPAPKDVSLHVDQMRSYLAATGAQRGAILYVTTGFARWVL